MPALFTAIQLICYRIVIGRTTGLQIMDENVWIVIAAYKEQDVIASVVKSVRRYYPQVIVVSDGSPDRTAEEAASAGATVLRHAVNLGQGAALQTGIDYALLQGAQFLVTFDADGQHRVEDIGVMIAELQARKADIALGSRFLGRAEGLSRRRRLVLKMGTIFNYLITGILMTDAHNGLRVLTADAARRIRIRHNGMAHASEIVESIARQKLKYIEVPIVVLYSDYSRSKGQRLGNAFNIVVDLLAGKVYR